MSTNNLSLAAEFGRFPLIISGQVRIIKCWLNLHSIKNENCILNTLNLLIRNEVKLSKYTELVFEDKRFITT